MDGTGEGITNKEEELGSILSMHRFSFRMRLIEPSLRKRTSSFLKLFFLEKRIVFLSMVWFSYGLNCQMDQHVVVQGGVALVP